MNELDFIDALSDRDTRRDAAAREFLGKLKTSGLQETAAQTLGWMKGHVPEIGAATAGAVLLTGGQYLMNRSKNGKPSVEQRSARALLASSEAAKDAAERDNRPLTFKEDFMAAGARSAKEWSDAFERHPGRGALKVAPVGAVMGLGGLALLKKILK